MTTAVRSPFTAKEFTQLRDELPDAARGGYLNAGFMGPIPRATYDAQLAELDASLVDRVFGSWPDRLTELHTTVRARVAALTRTTPEHVALMQATHPGINSALWGLDLTAGDNVVTTDEEHPGLVVPLQVQAARRRIEVRVVPVGDGGEELTERVLAQTDARTRAVAVSHVSWVSGTVLPIRELGTVLAPGIPLIVDGAQGAGAVDLDLTGDWCAAYTISGQKWTLGPNGSGALVMADPERFAPVFGTYGTVADIADIEGSGWNPDGRRLEFAQESFPTLAGWAASLQLIVDRVRTARAEQHSAWLNVVARDAITAAATDRGVAPPYISGYGHLLIVRTPAGLAPTIVNSTAAHGHRIRALGPDRIRISLGFWNSADEVGAACADLVALLGTQA